MVYLEPHACGAAEMPNDAKRFRARLQKEVLHHPIIEANAYTEWFRRGEFSTAQARAFVIQFSVFSNEFLVAQLRKMLEEGRQ